MKSLILLTALAFSTTAFSGEALMKLNRNSGFSPFPYHSVLSVYETGKVILVKEAKGTKTKTQLETLSPNTIQEIKDNIDALKAKDKLVDADANKPRCTDAPSSSIEVKKGKKDLTIAVFASCHRSEMKSKAATALIKTIQDIDSKRQK